MSHDSRPPQSGPPLDTSSPERRLTRRLLLRSVTLISAAMAVILLVSNWISDQRHMARVLSDMDRQAAAVEDALRSIMLDSTSLKHERVQAFIGGIGRDSTFLGLRVITLDTTVAFSKNPDELGRKFDLRRELPCRQCHLDSSAIANKQRTYQGRNNDRAYHLVQPIRNGPECSRCHDQSNELRAIMVADFSLKYYDEDMASARLEQVAVFSVLLVLFTSFIYFSLRRLAYGPLATVAGRLKQIAGGDFSAHGTTPRNDLIGFVNRQIDTTAGHLRHLYDEMESRIAQRTQSLEHSQKALATEKDKLRLILDHSPQGVLWVARDGSILFANARAGTLLRCDPSTLSGASVQEFEILRQIFHEVPIENMIEKESGTLVTKHVGETAGLTRYFETVWSGVTDGDDQRPLFLMLNDVTERRGLEHEFARHEKLAAIGQLAAGVAHEVGNPLSAISALIQLVQKGSDFENQAHNLALVTYHIDRISRIVRNLSDFARVPDERSLPCRLGDIVRGAIEIASFDAKAKGVEIGFTHPKLDVELNVRRDQLMQAVLNILLNAFDALQGISQPKLTVAIADGEGTCSITIADNGSGIADENLDRIFEPFFTTKPVGEGTGLGLSVAYRIISDLGGEIEVESRAGHGTSFTIRLTGMERR